MKISVIIPVYNVEQYLEKCVGSVITQSFQDIEIILVDDGSPDNCPKICDKLASVDKRIQVIHKKNGGLSSARNAGLEIATGDLIYFLDSDDFIEPETLSVMASYFKVGVDIVIAGVKPFYISDTKPTLFDSMIQYFSCDNIVKKLKPVDVLKIPAIACGKLYRKSIIDKYKLRFDEGLVNEDESWNWYYNTKIKYGIVIPNRFYNYLIREDSIVGNKQNKGKKLNDILHIIDNSYNHLVTNKIIKRFKRRFYDWAQHLICATMATAEQFNDRELIRMCQEFECKYGKMQYSLGERIFSIKHTPNRKRKVLCVLGMQIELGNKK